MSRRDAEEFVHAILTLVAAGGGRGWPATEARQRLVGLFERIEISQASTRGSDEQRT